MIAPIRDIPPKQVHSTAQRRKARRWIVESLMTRPDLPMRPTAGAGWKHWVCAAWIVLAATAYLVSMLR